MPNNPTTTKMDPMDESSGARSDLVDHGDTLHTSIRRQDEGGGIEVQRDARDSFTNFGPVLMESVRTDNANSPGPSAKPTAAPAVTRRLSEKTIVSSASGSSNTPRSLVPQKRPLA